MERSILIAQLECRIIFSTICADWIGIVTFFIAIVVLGENILNKFETVRIIQIGTFNWKISNLHLVQAAIFTDGELLIETFRLVCNSDTAVKTKSYLSQPYPA